MKIIQKSFWNADLLLKKHLLMSKIFVLFLSSLLLT